MSRLPHRPSTLRLLALALLTTLAGCGVGEDEPVLRVSAAASLAGPFTELATRFEADHPDLRVELNLAGSTRLATQILEGAPVDVFASASEAVMDRVARTGGLASEPRIFARNRLALAVPRGNPAGVRGLSDLAREELVVGLCAPAVPCGALAREVLEEAGVTPAPDTEEPDVRALLTKLELGEVDVGLVYWTELGTAGAAVEGVEAPAAAARATRYPIAVVAGTDHPEAAQAFVAFVRSPDGRAVLLRHGFEVS